ncbi:ankyrin repeat-containing domain protein [Mycena epipterygia]|nr:ankyrin repeat-containing domain protein [Mycena epipterygia]
MAELLGTLTSILQLVDLALKARQYLKDFQNAPVEQRKMFTEIDQLQPLLKELQRLVSTSPPTNTLQQMTGPLDRFKTMMQNFTAKFELSDGRWSKLSKQLTWTLWNKKEAKEYLNEFESIKSLLDIWLSVHISDQQQHYQNILAMVADNAHRQNDAVEHKKILDWITPLNFFQRQADIFSVWQVGTGEWLLSDPQFKSWESGTEQVLWCRGIPGAGKTVLSSMVVNHLRVESLNDIGVACVYLNHKETEVQTPVNLLAALWKQLVIGKTLSSAVHALYQQHHERDTRPSLDEILNLLQSAMAQHSRTYFIVDALDEYPEDQRDVLLRYLSLLSRPTTSLMITSRPHVTLDPFLPNVQMMEIYATEDDILQYVDMHIQQSPRLFRHIKAHPELQEEICSKIINNVEGMFLLAKLHIESLATKNTIKAIRDALQHLPKDLNQTYDEAMERINRQNEDDTQLAKLALTWVAYAKRPLSVAELREALAIDPDASTLDVNDLLDINIVLSVSAGLIIVDETMSVVRLIHYTAQHYFDKIQTIKFPSAHTTIASRCLTYLSFSEFSHIQFKQSAWIPHETTETWVMEHPMIVYSQYVLLHAANSPGLDIYHQIENFLCKANSWRKFWFALEWGSPAPPWNYGDWPSLPSLLWFSAISNLIDMARYLLVHGMDAKSKTSALCAAAFYGHLEMVKLLVESGADPNVEGGMHGTALRSAAYNGSVPVVQHLIEHGADVNTRGKQHVTALHAAASAGEVSVVQLLIDKGAKVNAQSTKYGTALQAAALAGEQEVVQLLLTMGANVNAHGGEYGTALQAAVRKRNEPLIQFLIGIGANVNTQGGYYGTALQAASYMGYDLEVGLLIEMGAEVNAQGGGYGNALQAAAVIGHEPVVQLLIEKGAQVNAQGGYFGTALQAAAFRGHESIVQLLMMNGANVNAQGARYNTALQAASWCGCEPVVQLLIENAAEVNTQGGEYGTALQAGSCMGHEQVVKLLLEKGADVNAHGGKHGTALQAAAYWGQEQVVKFLIENGAHVNTQVQDTTALWKASMRGHESVVQLLIENGVDVNANGYYGTALQAASIWGHESVVHLLLANGADTGLDSEPPKRPKSVIL